MAVPVDSQDAWLGPRFDIAVARNGYAWWYVDALSADGSQGFTIIAFIGSVFSPFYALARARGRGDPENHVAMNVALYGKPRRWAMTERGGASLRRDAKHIAIGASAMSWDGAVLTIDVDETTVPLPLRLRGRITLRPRSLQRRRFELDDEGRHRWQPIAPLSDVDVAFEAPSLSWSGVGYVDTNEGEEPLEDCFQSWTWARFNLGDHARIFYDVLQKNGSSRNFSLTSTDRGADADLVDAARLVSRPGARTLYQMSRSFPCDPGSQPVLLRTLEDTPFYARSMVASRIDGIEAIGVHETLSLTRVASPIVRCMLPFKMFRRRAAPNMGVG